MKTTINGYRLTKNGKPILHPLEGERVFTEYKGDSFKENGIYYFYIGKRGECHVYSE